MKLSIITINLNNAEGLEKTIRSVLSQTFTDYEWLLIDGGSTDESKDIIKKYSDRFSYLVTEPDTGIYHAQNKGIVHATGDYCFFLNSGDYLADSSVLENIFEAGYKEDILFGNLYVAVKDKLVGKAFGKANLTFADVYSHTIKHQASFFRRSLFDSFGFYDENRKIIADWEFFIKTIGLGNVSYRYIDLFISYFDNDGFSNQNPEVVLMERGQVIKEQIPAMMYPDYEYLFKYKRYQNVFMNRFSFFIVRLMNKLLFK